MAACGRPLAADGGETGKNRCGGRKKGNKEHGCGESHGAKDMLRRMIAGTESGRGCELMIYESVATVPSRIASGVQFTVAKMSFGRRTELMRQVRELAGKVEFLEAGKGPGEKMDGALLRVEIDRLYVKWGLVGISGLELDGVEATPESLAESGPEELFREALALVRSQAGLNADERKN